MAPRGGREWEEVGTLVVYKDLRAGPRKHGGDRFHIPLHSAAVDGVQPADGHLPQLSPPSGFVSAAAMPSGKAHSS